MNNRTKWDFFDTVGETPETPKNNQKIVHCFWNFTMSCFPVKMSSEKLFCSFEKKHSKQKFGRQKSSYRSSIVHEKNLSRFDQL